MPPLVSPQNAVWKNECRNSILMTCRYQDLVSASDWLKQISHMAWPIRSTTQIWVGHVISMEFLHLFLRQHFARKPMVMLQNFSCFLRLHSFLTLCRQRNEQMKRMTLKTSKMVMCNIRNVVSRKPGAFIINYHLQSVCYNPNGICKGMCGPHPQDKQQCYKHE